MLIWLLYERAWTLAVGGAVVGYLTNWLALKLIFEPVEPRRVGPLVVQGLFLKRQDEVSREFASFMAANVLTAPQLWDALLAGSRSSGFWRLLALRIDSGVLAVGLGWDMLQGNRAIDLDTSCAALSERGEVIMAESVYFAQLRSSRSILREGRRK